MSKQLGFDALTILTTAQCNLAETLYKQMLRAAVEIASIAKAEAPVKKLKVEKPAASGSMLFSAARNLPEEARETAAAAAASADAADVQFDPVNVEIERWSYLPPETIQSYIASDGIVNHFKLLWEMRARFPLHFIVFKQVSSHLAHEANVEQYFSRAGLLSDPNMDAYYLGILVMVGTNKSKFKPAIKAILERYYSKFRGKGGVNPEEPEGHAEG